MKPKTTMTQGRNKLLFFLFFLYSYTVNAQFRYVIDSDTIYLKQYQVIIDFPFSCVKTTTSYEEGFFVCYTNPKDSSYITIHIGHMVSKPLISSKYNVLNKFLFEDEMILQTGSYNPYDTLSDKLFFKEIDFLKKGIAIMYEAVKKNRIDEYEKIINNIKIYKK